MSDIDRPSTALPGAGAHVIPLRNGAPARKAIVDVVIVTAIFGVALTAGYITGATWLGIASVIFGVGASHVALRRRGLRWRDMGLGAPRRPLRIMGLAILATIGLVVISVVSNAVLNAVFGAQPDLSAFEELPGNTVFLAQLLIISWTSAAFGEEMLFRGFLMNRLHQAFGGTRRAWIVSATVQAAIFGVGHIYQGPAGAISVTFIAMGLVAVYILSGCRLWVTIMAHGLFDTTGFVLFYLGAIPGA